MMKKKEEEIPKSIARNIIVNEHDIIVTTYGKKGTIIHKYQNNLTYEVEFKERIATIHRRDIAEVISFEK